MLFFFLSTVFSFSTASLAFPFKAETDLLLLSIVVQTHPLPTQNQSTVCFCFRRWTIESIWFVSLSLSVILCPLVRSPVWNNTGVSLTFHIPSADNKGVVKVCVVLPDGSCHGNAKITYKSSPSCTTITPSSSWIRYEWICCYVVYPNTNIQTTDKTLQVRFSSDSLQLLWIWCNFLQMKVKGIINRSSQTADIF